MVEARASLFSLKSSIMPEVLGKKFYDKMRRNHKLSHKPIKLYGIRLLSVHYKSLDYIVLPVVKVDSCFHSKINQSINIIFEKHITYVRASDLDTDQSVNNAKFAASVSLASLELVVPRGSAVEHQSLASVLSPSCAGPVADG